MPVIYFNQQFVNDSLICPEGKSRIEFCDRDLPGLYIAVSSKSPGVGTYYLRYKDVNSKTCHQKIGRTTDISLADARKRAKALKAEIALGKNPQQEARERKAELTLSEAFHQHYYPHARSHKRSYRKDETMFRLRIEPRFGHLRLNQIRRDEVLRFHNELKESGLSAATADHHLKLARRILNYCVNDLEILDRNPIAKVKLFNEDNRRMDDHLSDEEFDRLLTTLKNDDSPVRFVFLFLIATAMRLNEALKARWSDVDRENGTLTISAANAKSKRMKTVPLNSAAMEILDQLQTDGEHLFINPKTGKRYVAVHKAWERLRQKAGLPNLWIHSLRRWQATYLLNAGVEIKAIKDLLGHRDISTTERYAVMSTKRLQQVSEKASQRIQEVV